MNNNLNNFFCEQQNSIINEFFNAMSDCLVATTLNKMESHRRDFGWKVEYLPKFHKQNVFILKKTDKSFPEIWVRNKYTNYRNAFNKYLEIYHSITNHSIPFHWQIDHLISQLRFSLYNQIYYHRLVFLKRKINASFGAGYEKRFYNREKYDSPSSGFHMDWITFLKIYGVKLPKIGTGYITWAKWVWNLAKEISIKYQEDRFHIYFGISTVLNLGYTNNYMPLILPKELFIETLHYESYLCYPFWTDIKKTIFPPNFTSPI